MSSISGTGVLKEYFEVIFEPQYNYLHRRYTEIKKRIDNNIAYQTLKDSLDLYNGRSKNQLYGFFEYINRRSITGRCDVHGVYLDYLKYVPEDHLPLNSDELCF